jgi:diguanylate cyclase (GGDEF)-like protein
METSSEQLRILVADDSPLYRKLVEQALSREEYAVAVATSGREAVDLLSVHRPAIVITDWEMPDLTGIELCGHIRRDERLYTYVILLTSNDAKNQIVKGLAAGADDYLTKPFDPAELLARVVVGRRIVAMQREIQAKNRLLEELALTDSLTGLSNRRAIEHWAKRELSGAARHSFSVWVVAADLDCFKSVNDNYGHEAGDLVLKRFAEILKANTRASNISGRVGGEEFLMVLGHIARQDVVTATDRIRRQFESEKFVFSGKSVTVTASFGISGFQGTHAPEFDQLVREADTALYAAKRSGRNRIEFAQTSPAEPRSLVL